jgi:hypothetical protein
VSFSEDCVRFGDRLVRLIGAGVSVREAAAALGISRQRCYAILRARGRPIRSSGVGRGPADREQIVAVFTATGSVNQAAKSAGVSHSLARRLLVAEGLVSPARQPRGKAAARRRFLELIEAGWSASRAAREVGVHVRTAATVAPSVAVAVVVMLSVASVSDIPAGDQHVEAPSWDCPFRDSPTVVAMDGGCSVRGYAVAGSRMTAYPRAWSWRMALALMEPGRRAVK